MKSGWVLWVGRILCFGFVCLAGKSWAVDYILNTPGSTVTNGSGTTYVSGDTLNKPDISNGLADGDTITLTTASGGTAGQDSIHTTGVGSSDYGIRGASGQGNNTVTLESGSSIVTDNVYTYGVMLYGTTSDENVTGIVGGTPDNTLDMNGSIRITSSRDSGGVCAEHNNSINLNGSIETTGENYGVYAKDNNSINLSGSIETTGQSASGVLAKNNNTISLSGSIKTAGGNAEGVMVLDNNSINVNGNIDTASSGVFAEDNNNIHVNGNIETAGKNAYGVRVYVNNSVNMSGNIKTVDKYGYGVLAFNNNTINVSGSIETAGQHADGVGLDYYYNSVNVSGSINTSGASANGISTSFAGNSNDIVIRSTGNINVSGNESSGICVNGNGGKGSVVSIAGMISATGQAQDALSVESNSTHALNSSNSFYLFSGAIINGDITAKYDSGFGISKHLLTSQLVFGYGVNSATGKADRTGIDSAFSFTFNDIITITGSAAWDGFFAGGTTTLNGSTNQLCRIFVGADSFDGTTVTDGHDGAGNYKTATLDSLSGAVATLTINNSISTINAEERAVGVPAADMASVAVGSGSTYNLNGTHTHEFGNADSFNVLGTLNLGAGGSIVDYEGNDAVELVLGGKANNGAGATVGGTLNSEASAQEISLKVYTGADSSINIGAGKLTVNSSQTQTLDTLSIANGAIGEVAVTSNAFSLSNFSNNGSVAFKVGKVASLVNGTGSAVDLSGSKGTLALDLGDEADIAVYAKASGEFKSAGDSTAGNKIESIYGVNGVAGTTYAGVFDAALTDMNDVAFADGAILNSEDRYRKYTLVNNVGNNPFDIRVENNNMMRATIEGMGGDATAAKAADFLIENEGSFNPSGQAFVQRFAALQGHDLLVASQQLAGEDATTGALQAGLQTVADAADSVRNQMTSMRMGNISAGMASSFSSSGATAALDDISGADELAVAYEADYTASAESGTYKQIEVWATGFGGFGEQGSAGSMTGWDFWNAGAMIGLDYAIGQELRIGGLFGYSYNKTTSYDSLGESLDNALRFGAYASYNYDNFFVDLSATMGVHILESKRNLVANNLIATGKRTALDFNINGTIGYTFNLPAEFVLTPSFSLGYTYYHDPNYTETGGGAGNLSIESFDSNSLLQDIGLKAGKLFRYNDRLAFLPEVWSGWEVEYFNTGGYRNSTTAAAIGSQSYSSTMNGMAINRGYFGLGLTALIGDNVSVFGRYDHKLWDKGFNAWFSAGVKISF